MVGCKPILVHHRPSLLTLLLVGEHKPDQRSRPNPPPANVFVHKFRALRVKTYYVLRGGGKKGGGGAMGGWKTTYLR